MKRFALAIIASLLVLSIAGCSVIDQLNEITASEKKIITEQDIDYEEDIAEIDTELDEVEEDVEEDGDGYNFGVHKVAPWEIKPTLICNDKDIIVTAEELIEAGRNGDAYALVLWVGNDRKDDINLGIHELYVNNFIWRYDDEGYEVIKAGEQKEVYLYFHQDDLSEYMLSDIGLLSLSVSAYTDNNYKLFESDLVEMETSGFKTMSIPRLRGGYAVVDDDKALIQIVRYGKTNDERKIGIFATNKTDKKIFIYGENITVNGKSITSYTEMDIPAGKSQFFYYDFEDDYDVYAAIGSYDFNSMVISVGYRTDNTLDFDNYGVVAIDFTEDIEH